MERIERKIKVMKLEPRVDIWLTNLGLQNLAFPFQLWKNFQIQLS